MKHVGKIPVPVEQCEWDGVGWVGELQFDSAVG